MKMFKQTIDKYYRLYIPLYEMEGSIEVDEVFLKAKRKGNMGRLPNNDNVAIVLGFFCRETKNVILYHIEDKSSNSITPLLTQTIAENSIVYTDKNSVYVNNRTNRSKIEDLLNVNHFWVNHTKRFVDLYDKSIHTNNIERTWRRFRNNIGRIRRAIPQNNINKEISYYLFNRNIHPVDKLSHLINCILVICYE
jgi:hypothetical protein